MPSHWCQCNDCRTAFLVTPGNLIQCPVCYSSNVTVLSTIPDEPEKDDDDQ